MKITAIKKFARALFGLVAATALCTSCADTKADSAPLKFHSAPFERYCLAQFDSDGDGAISAAEAARVTEIDVAGGNYDDLRDVAQFGNLTDLVCNNNALTELPLASLPRLQRLVCSNNRLAEIDLGRNGDLVELWCDHNLLTQLELHGCPALGRLFCFDNLLDHLDLSPCKALVWLYASGNRLHQIDLSHNSSLRQIDLGGNLLAQVDLAECPSHPIFVALRAMPSLVGVTFGNIGSLQELRLDGCGLAQLGLGGATSLYMLTATGSAALQQVDLTDCAALQHIALGGCHLAQTIDVSPCESLNYLSLVGGNEALRSIRIGSEAYERAYVECDPSVEYEIVQ